MTHDSNSPRLNLQKLLSTPPIYDKSKTKVTRTSFSLKPRLQALLNQDYKSPHPKIPLILYKSPPSSLSILS